MIVAGFCPQAPGDIDRRTLIQQARGLELVYSRQILEAIETEIMEEARRRAPGHRPSGRTPPALRPDPARLEEDVEGALAQADTADLLDLGPGDRLVIGDDGKGLDRRARQLAGHRCVHPELRREIGRRVERPVPSGPDQVDAAVFIEPGELGEQSSDIGPVGKAGGDGHLVKGLGGGEQHRLEQA